jgi:hypothetical protein
MNQIMSSRRARYTSAGPITHTILPPRSFLRRAAARDGVVHRPLARHFGRHEAEFVGAAGPAQESFGMHEDAFRAVFGGADCDFVARGAHAPRLSDDQDRRPGAVHDHAIHARQARRRQPLGSCT